MGKAYWKAQEFPEAKTGLGRRSLTKERREVERARGPVLKETAGRARHGRGHRLGPGEEGRP